MHTKCSRMTLQMKKHNEGIRCNMSYSCNITGYGSTLYIGIIMVHLESWFLLSISDFSQFYSTTHVETKLYAKYFLKIPILAKIITKYIFPILSMFFFFFFFFLLNSRNSITVIPIDMKLDI